MKDLSAAACTVLALIFLIRWWYYRSETIPTDETNTDESFDLFNDRNKEDTK